MTEPTTLESPTGRWEGPGFSLTAWTSGDMRETEFMYVWAECSLERVWPVEYRILREVARGGSRIDAVDGRCVACGTIDEQHRRSEFLFQIGGHYAGGVAADGCVGAAEYGAVDGVVGYQGERGAILMLQLDEADLAVDRAVGIEAETDLAIDVAGAAIDIRH